MKLNKKTQENILNLRQINYLLSAYININVIYFEINHRNRSI